MKKTIAVLMLLALNAQAKSFSNLRPPHPFKVSETLIAEYQGYGFLAWTGDENNSSSKLELQALAQSRADEACRFFGFIQSAKVTELEADLEADPSSLKPLTVAPKGSVPGVRMAKSGILISGGKLQVETKVNQGHPNSLIPGVNLLGDFGRFFKNITCYK